MFNNHKNKCTTSEICWVVFLAVCADCTSQRTDGSEYCFTITIMLDDEEIHLESVMEGDECTICFNGKWFRNRDDFFKDACIGNRKLTAIAPDCYGFEFENAEG